MGGGVGGGGGARPAGLLRRLGLQEALLREWEVRGGCVHGKDIYWCPSV